MHGGDITVKGEGKDAELLVHVANHGAGIPEEAMLHLSERFYRGEHSAMVGGTGLGLYILKQIIEAHGGRIWLESKVEKGSTFSFSLLLDQTGGDFSLARRF